MFPALNLLLALNPVLQVVVCCFAVLVCYYFWKALYRGTMSLIYDAVNWLILRMGGPSDTTKN
jgi:hypothetical protein